MRKKSGCITPRDAENYAMAELKRKFGQEFTKQEIVIGNKKREFDLVSDDDTIVAQVKTCQKRSEHLTDAQRATRYKRGYVFDCLLLERVPKGVKHRIFYLFADESEFEKFQEWSYGLISPEVELRFVDAWNSQR